MNEIIIIVVAGMLGALIKEILQDNKLKLPKISNGEIQLGFVGGIIIGAVAGYVIDGSFVTAFMGGYTGTALIENLVLKKDILYTKITETVEDKIKRIAKEMGVDPELAVRVARAESALNPTARNTNTEGSIDRGVFQINSYYHPDITNAQADDVEFATRFFCKAVKAGNLSWWNASKHVWNV